MDILFNSKGVPLMMSSETVYGETLTDRETRRNYMRREVLQPHDNWAYDFVWVGKHKVVA
jgi:hypothetical protein